eukprot:TRINITY_DN24104_c0_g1_i2.p1 TRINITY_DN24104_c0_g1~~TRINITY_DN24104_c0_g1_i2.p1  ORF type:complete len:181 (-),score=36.76 TRINITY_DN24104_c0_g1_i2:239-781(-)
MEADREEADRRAQEKMQQKQEAQKKKRRAERKARRQARANWERAQSAPEPEPSSSSSGPQRPTFRMNADVPKARSLAGDWTNHEREWLSFLESLQTGIVLTSKDVPLPRPNFVCQYMREVHEDDDLAALVRLYRTIARRYHPDKVKQHTSKYMTEVEAHQTCKKACGLFQQVSNTYMTLV